MYILYIIAALLAAILITMLGAWGFVGDAAGVLIVVGLIGVAVWIVSVFFLDFTEWVWQSLKLLYSKISIKSFRATKLKKRINEMHQMRYSYGDEKQQQELADLEQALKEIEAGK
jgi:hypothetical protein